MTSQSPLPGVRAQYHLRRTANGNEAFDVRRLIQLTRDLPVRLIDPATLPELDENHWYFHTASAPTPRSILEHVRLIRACDLSYPIILDQCGRVMDGMHRVLRALLEGIDEIPAVRFEQDPSPDYVNCDPRALPYDE